MRWWEFNEEERVKKVYSKYKIKDFWEWWSSGERRVMEVRITDWETIKKVAAKCNLHYSRSGVYVWNDMLLKKVIALVRNEHNIWFSVNPRKKNYNLRGWKVYQGGDYWVDNISFLFIDIDRIRKVAPASPEELMACDEMAELILERLGTTGWNKSFLKICSGNGVQLLIKLDVPIKIPSVEFDKKNKMYLTNAEFDEMKRLIKDGIGRQIRTFTKRYKDRLMVEVDKTVFNIGRVGALPMTKNFKFESFTWRAILEMKDEPNDGLSDYVLSSVEDLQKFKKGNVFASARLIKENILRPGKMEEHPLARFMLENDFPMGGINNTLWFSMKMLLRDSKFDLKGVEFRKFHEKIKKRHKRGFTLNIPGKEHQFSPAAVNNFCINNGFPIVFENQLWENRGIKMDMKLDGMTYTELMEESGFPIKLDKETTIIEDMESFSKHLIEGDYLNVTRVGGFLKAVIKKYGEEKARYFQSNLFYKYFSYSTK